MARTVVLAIGGNALAPSGLGDHEEAERLARGVASVAADMLADGSRLVLVHGNGPQVGALALAQEAVARDVPPQPLFVLGAMTQGQLGYLLSQALGDELASRGRSRGAAAIVTQVVVDPEDPAFQNPTKPIGPFFPEGRARRLAEARGWSVAEDAGRGWRRVVPSPIPIEVVEREQIDRLLAENDAIVACGGGGIPVRRAEQGLEGVEAVIDKDHTAALLARLVAADTLMLLTGVDRVALDFGTDRQREVAEMSLAEARGHLADGQFPPGSMGPKVEAAIGFVEEGGEVAVITSLEHAARALAGETGTRVIP